VKETIKALPSDLDWIVMKALDKDRRRRYDTPNEIAADITRHLNNEPVQASPPSTAYQLNKFVRRHRVMVTAGIAVLVALTVGITLALMGYVKAEREAANAKAVLEFLSDDLLALADPKRAAEQNVSPDREIQLRTAIRQAALRIGDRFIDQPSVEAEIRMRIGEAFLNLGELDDAESQLTKAKELFQTHSGATDRKTLQAQELIGRLRLKQDKRLEAIGILEEALSHRKRLFESDDADLFSSMNALALAYAGESEGYDQAESLYLAVIDSATRSRGELDKAVLQAKQGLSQIYYESGLDNKTRDIDRDLRHAIQQQFNPDHPDSIRAAIDEIFDLRYLDFDAEAAASSSSGLLERATRVLGDTDGHTLLLLRELNVHDQRRGLWGGSILRQSRQLDRIKESLPVEHEAVLGTEDRLGGFYFWFGDFERAVQTHRDTIMRRAKKGLPESIAETRSERYLSMNLFRLGEFEEAESLYREVVRKSVDALGFDSSRTIYNNRLLLRMLTSRGKWSDATDLFLEYTGPSINSAAESKNPLGQLPVHTSFLASSMALDDEATRTLLNLVLKFGETSESARVRTEIAKYGVMLDFSKLEQQQDRLIDFALQSNASDRSVEVRLLRAAVSYRSKRYQESLDLLGALPKNPENFIAAQAGLLAAMAFHELKEKRASIESLDQARYRVDLLLRQGLLQHKVKQDAGYVTHWADIAVCLLLRREAESLILGETASPRVDEAFLASARLEWTPTQTWLEEMETQARSREWNKAYAALEAAMNTGPINWDAHGNHIQNLRLKAALLLALNGRTEQLMSFCSSTLENVQASQTGFMGLAVILPEADGRRYVATLLPELRRAVAGLKSEGGGTIWKDRTRMELGIAELRMGNNAEAWNQLMESSDAFNLNTAGTASAYAAICARRLGNDADSVTFLKKARQIRAQLLSGNPDQLYQGWHEFGLLELALREAERETGR